MKRLFFAIAILPWIVVACDQAADKKTAVREMTIEIPEKNDI
ncbi:MAG: hypothetical protein QM640_02115 [Niabella sp.]